MWNDCVIYRMRYTSLSGNTCIQSGGKQSTFLGINTSYHTQYRPLIPYSLKTPITLFHLLTISIPSEQYTQVYKCNDDPIEYKKVPVLKPAPDEVLNQIYWR